MIEAATKALFDLCMESVEHVVRRERYAEIGIPTSLHDLVRPSWDEDDPAVCGRFGLGYDGTSP